MKDGRYDGPRARSDRVLRPARIKLVAIADLIGVPPPYRVVDRARDFGRMPTEHGESSGRCLPPRLTGKSARRAREQGGRRRERARARPSECLPETTFTRPLRLRRAARLRARSDRQGKVGVLLYNVAGGRGIGLLNKAKALRAAGARLRRHGRGQLWSWGFGADEREWGFATRSWSISGLRLSSAHQQPAQA